MKAEDKLNRKVGGAHVRAAFRGDTDGNGAVGAPPAEVAVASALEAVPMRAAVVQGGCTRQHAGILAQVATVRTLILLYTHAIAVQGSFALDYVILNPFVFTYAAEERCAERF